jgi:hypothetical protein
LCRWTSCEWYRRSETFRKIKEEQIGFVLHVVVQTASAACRVSRYQQSVRVPTGERVYRYPCPASYEDEEEEETYNVSARTVLQGTVEIGIVRDGLP